MRMRISSSKQHKCVRGPLQECRSIRSGASGLPYYCTPLVCISAVIGLLGARLCGGITNQKPKTTGMKVYLGDVHFLVAFYTSGFLEKTTTTVVVVLPPHSWPFFFWFGIHKVARQLHQECTLTHAHRCQWIFLVFGLLCRHTASNSITCETHTSGAQ